MMSRISAMGRLAVAKVNLIRAAASAVLLFAWCCPANAQLTVINEWTFETSQPATAGPFAPEIIGMGATAGSASGSHVGAAVYSSPAGNGSAHSFSSNTWATGDYYQFQTSTTGFSGIMVQWDQVRSGTGPASFHFGYSTDDINFTNLPSYTVLSTPSWSTTVPQVGETYTVDLSSLPALSNVANVYFRLVDDSVTGSAAGTNRVDNFIIGTPEPASLSLAGVCLAGLAGARWQRRKAAAV